MNRLRFAYGTRSASRGALGALILAITTSITGIVRAEPTDATVHFVPASPDLVLSIQRGEVAQNGRVLALRRVDYYGTTYTPIYETVCEGECTRTFAAGTMRLALGKKGGTPTAAPAPLLVTGPATLRGDFVDRSGQRTVGKAIAIVGGVGEAIVGGYDLLTGENAAIGFAGFGVMLSSLIIGSLIALAHDETTFTLTPLSTGVSGGSRESGSATSIGHGGGLAFRF